jgi:hypothetical protein
VLRKGEEDDTVRWYMVVAIVLMTAEFIVHSIKHGEERTPFHAGFKLLDILVWSLLLWYGGFWK